MQSAPQEEGAPAYIQSAPQEPGAPAYIQSAPQGEGAPARVSVQDVQACIGDTAGVTLDDIVDAASGGDLDALDRALIRIEETGTAPVAVLAMVIRHFERLHFLSGVIETGTNQRSAIDALRPPVHFRRRAALERQVRQWSRTRLAHALTILAQADLQCKTTGLPAKAVCSYTLLRLAQASRAPGRQHPRTGRRTTL